MLHHMKTLKTPRYEHYDLRYTNDNVWAFLGNGRVERELKDTEKDLAPFIRNEDTPWTI
jgi:hypothetical protein